MFADGGNRAFGACGLFGGVAVFGVGGGDDGDGFVDGIGEGDDVEVFGADGADGDEGVAHIGHEWLPELYAHENERELLDLGSLYEDCGLKDFVHRAKPPRHGDEGIGVFHEHHFADEKVAELNEAVEVGVGLLLEGELDVAADGDTFGIAGTTVGGFHDARAATGHDGELSFGEGFAGVAGELVVLVVFVESGRAKHCDARADKMELAESADELAKDADGAEEFFAAEAWAREQALFVARRRLLAPGRALRRIGGEMAVGRFVFGISHNFLRFVRAEWYDDQYAGTNRRS